MPEQIKIPKILQERDGPSLRERVGSSIHEVVTERRKKISKEMARVILDITFNKRSIRVDDYDPDNPEKYDQDVAFATYEPNLRETHRQRMKSIGSMAMVMSGMDLAAGVFAEKRGVKAWEKSKRKAYIARNGTMKDRIRDRYIARMTKD